MGDRKIPEDSNIGIREGHGMDIPFIYSTWLRSFKTDSAIGKTTRNYVFFNEYKLVLDRILENNDTDLFVAIGHNSPYPILGYLVVEGDIIHYSFVKENFRRYGIFSQLYHHTGL